MNALISPISSNSLNHMEVSIKTTVLFLAIILTGLSSGFFYAWEVSVIPGTKQVSDSNYLETMQIINRAVLNPAFFLIFFGSLIVLMGSSYLQYTAASKLSFWFMLAATLTYLIGTFGVTVVGNVPLNEGLDVVVLEELGKEAMHETRMAYEGKWNRLHTIRTVFSVIAFLFSLLAAFSDNRIPTLHS